MRLRKGGGWSRGSVAARASSAVRGDAVLLFLMPAQVWGGRHNLAVAKAEAKTEVAANSEELKLI